MTRRDDVLRLLAEPGATQASVAARLGISQQRVSILLRGPVVQPPGSAPVVQPPAAEPGCTTPNTAQPVVQPTDPAALREQVIAELRAAIREQERGLVRAAFESRWSALTAERDELRARVAELEAAPGTGPCPGCATRDAAYEALEEMLTDARQRLAAWEDHSA